MDHGNNQTRSAIPQAAWCQLNRGRIRRLLGYYGLTADWQCADRWRAYASLEREEGDGYTQDYDVNIGVRYAF